MSSAPIGTIHHVELWVPDIDRAAAQWGWLLTELGYQPFQEWTGGCSWRLADTYIVIEQSPDMLAEPHDRKRPGLNHLAFHAGDQAQVDALTAAAAENGWALMFADKHPHAGGPQTYAAYLSNTDGHEVELTASNPVTLTHPQVLTIPPTNWLKAADVQDGLKPGTTAAENAELREAKKRIRLLEQENEVLRRAAAYLSQANLPGK